MNVHLPAHVEHDASHLRVRHRPKADRVEGAAGDTEATDVDAVGGGALVHVVLGKDDLVVAAGDPVEVRLGVPIARELRAPPVLGMVPTRVDSPGLGGGVSRDLIFRSATLHLRRLKLLYGPFPGFIVDQLQTAMMKAFFETINCKLGWLQDLQVAIFYPTPEDSEGKMIMPFLGRINSGPTMRVLGSN